MIDKASLIQIPSGYKATKLYSLIPSNGDGDFTFSRSSSATRVNSEGLIETAQVLGSEEITAFTNGTTYPFTTFATSGNNITSAIVSSAFAGVVSNSISLISGEVYKVSFDYVKNSGDDLRVVFSNSVSGAGGQFSNVELVSSSGSYDLYLTVHTTISNAYLQMGTGSSSHSLNIAINNVSVKEVFENDVPRLDYSDGSCASLLLEPQSTNLVTQSETFSNWNTEGGKQVVTQGVLISPDGTLNGNKLETYNTASSNPRKLWVAYSVTVGASYTFSVYIKQVSGQINSGFLHITTGANDTFNVSQAYIATDQWQRVSVTTNSAASSQIRFLITGDANSQIYIWGAQVEQQSYATSYIPTSGSTVTRTADSFQSVNASNWSSVEGTINLNLQAFEGDNTYRQFSLYGSGNDSLVISYTNTTNQVTSIMKVGGSTVFYMATTLTDASDLNKIAFAYSSGRAKLFINGVQRGTSSASYTTSEGVWTKFCSNIGASYNYYFGKVDGIYISKTALTDEELTTLTTI